MSDSLNVALQNVLERAYARLQSSGSRLAAQKIGSAEFERLVLASDFAVDALCRQPWLLADIDAEPLPPPILLTDSANDWPGQLRQWRVAESARLIWRDVSGRDAIEATLAGSSRIAEQALETGLSALEHQFSESYGHVCDARGRAQRLVVFGLGKLGGGELNFSSDIDLIYAFCEHGQSDGSRSLDAEAYFTRLGQRLTQLLGETTADGFCHRVDLRLRPFGASGRIALSFAAMEQYYQREGRDWERYAWIKARPVAGDMLAGEGLLTALRPFVYRRYLDYTALDGLREMKALIDAEVQRRDLADNLKLGPGGIREIEFLVQALQLIRAGREPGLQQRTLLSALSELVAAGHFPVATADALGSAYRFLRRLENRVQMFADQQTHALPETELARERIARGLGYVDSECLLHELNNHRAVVSEAFSGLLQSRRRKLAPSALAEYWLSLPEGIDDKALVSAGFIDVESQHTQLRDFARSPAVRGLSVRARQRLDHVVPALIEASAESVAPDAALPRGLALLQAIVRRSSYLALLEEQPAALARLVDVTARSSLLSERLATHPLLLDELLDIRAAGEPLDECIISAQLQRQIALLNFSDTESTLIGLNELKQSLSFRIALAALTQRQSALMSTRQLAVLAEGLLPAVLKLAEHQMQATHGLINGVGFAVVGYGSLGGRELSFGSDLDLVFLHDAEGSEISDGPRPLEASRYFSRLAQKLVSLLTTVTSAGRLYEIDVRLRPDGAKGLLVSSLHSFSEYQQQRAWTWEQQALTRARVIAGSSLVREGFEGIRQCVLKRERDLKVLQADVIAMRLRMRRELDRSDGRHFDLKQGVGGLVDLEFLLQSKQLALAASWPSLSALTATPDLLHELADIGVFESEQARSLVAAHALFLARGLDCTLDQRPRLCLKDNEVELACHSVRHACLAHGLVFENEN